MPEYSMPMQEVELYSYNTVSSENVEVYLNHNLLHANIVGIYSWKWDYSFVTGDSISQTLAKIKSNSLGRFR